MFYTHKDTNTHTVNQHLHACACMRAFVSLSPPPSPSLFLFLFLSLSFSLSLSLPPLCLHLCLCVRARIYAPRQNRSVPFARDTSSSVPRSCVSGVRNTCMGVNLSFRIQDSVCAYYAYWCW